MKLSALFKLRTSATPAVLDLLTKTTLGTNGAMYKHLDTRSRILEADNPLFLSIERQEKALGNVTFCQRESAWYIRYFAFDKHVQGGTKKKTTDRGNSIIKRELKSFFDNAFLGVNELPPVERMYAYIDPHNDRSKWMSENFGFTTVRKLATQSFSRLKPVQSHRFKRTEDYEFIRSMVQKQYGQHAYFFETHCSKAPFFYLEGENKEVIACLHAVEVHWEIVRLPGRMGGMLTKLIPYIPVLKRLIKPKWHHFIVPEIVCVQNSDPKLLEELFTSVLAHFQANVLLWWSDAEDPLYTEVKNAVSWGMLHRIIGVNGVDVVERTKPGIKPSGDRPQFVTAFDMV